MTARVRRLTQPDLHAAAHALAALPDGAPCFAGFDGFVDHILDAVASRHAPGDQGYTRMSSLLDFASRAEAASGRSANIELVRRATRPGGNGPILAGALAALGAQVHCVGALDHPVFDELRAGCSSCVSVCEPGVTDALEFDDGKLMLGIASPMDHVTWDRIVSASGGIDAIVRRCDASRVIAPCGWTMVPAMTDIWTRMACDVLPRLDHSASSHVFIDFSDPAKRTDADLRAALDLLRTINTTVPVTLGLNLAEAQRCAALLGIETANAEPDPIPLAELAARVRESAGVARVAVHHHKAAALDDGADRVAMATAWMRNPLTSTGAGDHFNAGLCLALAHSLGAAAALPMAVAVSGLFVRTGSHPTRADVGAFLAQFPV
ncbi:MAG: hypothetical protein H6813_04615 [Phycisphaeraceae bacterium]|nr:hypothetical protein [Phycisphaeraceae bacterium]MCB9847232.1 hypothetical protein [Phycisphaeraceae bacterium]